MDDAIDAWLLENPEPNRDEYIDKHDEYVREKNVHEKELNNQKMVEKKPWNPFFKYRREAKELRERNDMIDPTVPDVPISSKMFSDVNTENRTQKSQRAGKIRLREIL